MKTKQKKINKVFDYLWDYYWLLINSDQKEEAEELEKFIIELDKTM